jgi:flagellar FliL protein
VTVADTDVLEPPKKASKKLLLIALVAAVLFGVGGFYLTFSGLLFGSAHDDTGQEAVSALPDVSFVPVAPITINLGVGGSKQFLRFSSQLEVVSQYEGDVTHLLPRISDVINGYLRAVEPEILEDPTALVRIRAQLLRRIQMVSGEGRVRDVLITEFILN